MPLKVLTASSTETLLEHLVDSLAAEGDPALLRPVLLPSRPLVERVQVALARRTGLSMGAEFLLPAAFLARVAEGLGMDPLHASWSAEGMFWRVLGILPDLAARHPERLNSACAEARSRAALALEVADRFDQYLHFRPALIDAWDRDLYFNEFLGLPESRPIKSIFKEGFPQSVLRDEAWQRELWRVLRGQLAGHPHPAQRLREMAARAATADLGVFEPAVEVLATGPLPFPILEMLRALGARMDVRLRVLLPANGYLDDIKPRWLQLVRGEAVDPEAEGNPLVAQMGRQSVELFRGLMSLSGDNEGQELEPVPETEDGRPSLLARLRSDVRALRQPDALERPVFETLPGFGNPLRSLRVHRCYGARREMEVLRDEILRAFADLEGLRPEDVLILAPDLDLYGPLAEAILAKGDRPRLPLGLAERRVERRDPLLKAVLSLLELASGRGALSEWLAFLDLPAVREALGEAPATDLAARLRTSGITFGFNAEHRKSLHAGIDPVGTWRDGLDRLLAGLWLDKEPAALDQTGRPVLGVFGDLGGGRRDLLRSLQWCDDLLTLLDGWRQGAPPELWARRVERALDLVLLTGSTRSDLGTCLDLARSLRGAGQEHGCESLLGPAEVADYLRAFGDDDQRRVSGVGGCVTLGGLKPLRALPCRVLAIVGLSDSAFPRRGAAKAWDLLAALPMPGDRDPRKDDRQLFLDSLLAASDRVILTAPVRNQHTDTLEPLSACVDEVVRAAVDTVGCGPMERDAWVEALIVDQPLQAFSPLAFSGLRGRDRSFDRSALELAHILAGPRREQPFAGSGEAANAEAQDCDLNDLLGFLKDPAKAFLAARGMAVPRAVENPADDDDEPMDEGAGLERWQLNEQALVEAMEGRDPCLLERLAADRLLPLGRLGRRRGEIAWHQAQRLATAIRRAADGNLEAVPCAAVVGTGLRLDGTLHRSLKHGQAVAWTAGFVEAQSGRGAWSADARTLLAAWLRACLASASGDVKPGLFVAVDRRSAEPVVLQLPSPDPGRVCVHLRLLMDLRERGRDRLLPFAPTTSHALAKALIEGKDFQGAAEGAWKGTDRTPGEGTRPAAALAWRGQDPSGSGYLTWQEPALSVWKPILDWWQGVRSIEAGGGT